MQKVEKIGGTVAFVLCALGALGTAVGCAGGGAAKGPARTAKGAESGASCQRGSIAKPLGQPRAGSTVALVRIGAKNIALVADEDANAIESFDIDTQKEMASTPLEGAPSQLMVTTDGRVVVLLRDRAAMQVLEAEQADGSLAARCTIETPKEPVALASTPDDKTLLVSSAWGQSLTAFDSARLTRSYEVALPREPRAVVVSDDGATAFVSHAVGSVVSAVDLTKPTHAVKQVALRGMEDGTAAMVHLQKARLKKMVATGQTSAEQVSLIEKQFAEQERIGCQGFALAKSIAPAGRILAPQVFVDPGRQEARPEGYGNGQTASETPSVAVIDEGTKEALDSSLAIERRIDWTGEKSARDHREDCLLPRAAATDPRARMLLVACVGIDDVIAYDAASANPQAAERRRWTVGSGPSGIAVDSERRRAVVWSQFERSVSVLSLDGADVTDEKKTPRPHVVTVALSPRASKLPDDVALGRLLYHSGGDTRISKDGRACASCHPDGRDDAITWATPEGPRRSILLAGRVANETAFAWNGNAKTLREHLGNTFDRLDGTGLRGRELDALARYVSTMRAPAERDVTATADAASSARLSRGSQIFASKEAACSSCHFGPTFSDGQMHDVQSKAIGDRGASFRTPSLRFVSGTGPYFHDGRYKTLHDLLRDVDGKMGHTKQLSEPDLDALEAYVRSL